MNNRIAVIGMTENKGGIESVVMNIYRNMDREKYQFDFLLPHDAGTMAYEDEVLELGGRIFRIIYSQRESIFKARKCYLNYFKEHPEVKGVHLHVNYPYAFPLKMAKKAGIQIRIIHAHNSAMLYEDENRIAKKIRNFLAYKQIKKYPTIFMSCSDLAAESTFKSDKYVWIKNGIDLDKFKFNLNARRELRKKYNIKDNDVVVGFVGRLCYRKNPIKALEIFKNYNDINQNSRMIIIGDGEQEEELDYKIKEYKLDDKVLRLGSIYNVSDYYQMMDIFLMTSLFEGLPVVLIEAQAAGVRCVVSDSVTRQVNITDLVTNISNDSSLSDWTIALNKQAIRPVERHKYSNIVEEAGFSSKNIVSSVTTYYDMVNKID